jgi:hypothetical protein
MKFFALWVCRTAILAVAILTSAIAQVPNPKPTTVPQPRKKPLAQPAGGNAKNATLRTKSEKTREKASKEVKKRAKEAKKQAKEAKKRAKEAKKAST